MRRALALLAVIGGLAGGALPAAADTAPTCPSYNGPNELTLAGGTPQSAKLGTVFDANLQVALANTNGCPLTTPLAGIAVTFAAPGTGPGGTFASSGANAVLVGTNATGGAAAPPFTANTLPGGYQVVASSDYGSVSFSLVNTATGVAATIVSIAPAARSAAVFSRYAQPLEAQVLDATGAPVQGANVSFSLGGSAAGSGAGGGGQSAAASFEGGSAAATAVTNSAGIAISPRFGANGIAGRFPATAAVGGVAEPARFALDNLAGKPPKVVPVGKTHLSARVGAGYGLALRVRVTGASAKPLEGQTVTFTLGSGGGSAGGASAGASFVGGAAQATETTDAAGLAVSPRFVAGSTAGTLAAAATVPGSNAAATFSLDDLAGRSPSIAAVAPTRLATAVDTRFGRPLEAKVLGGNGKPMQGQTVTFSLGAGAGSGSGSAGAGASFVGGSAQATATTNALGLAVSPRLEANATAGIFTAAATLSGRSGAASFSLDNLAGVPASLAAGAAASESAPARTRFAVPLAVTAADRHGNPVPGVLVTFTAPASGPGGTFAGRRVVRVRTNADGIAFAPAFTAGVVTGGYVVRASVGGAAAAFALVNEPRG